MVSSVLLALIILYSFSDNKKVETSLLFVITVYYCCSVQFDLLTQVSYEVLTLSSCTLLFSLFKYKELFWIVVSTLPFKIIEYVFYINPTIIPIQLYPYILGFESWYLYGVIALYLKLDSLNNFNTTRQTIVHGSVAFILVVPFINKYI